MAFLSFPKNPTVGMMYVAPNGYIYKYDGVKWAIASTTNATTPPPPNTGTTTGTNTGTISATNISMERYTFPESLRWLVTHNKNTTRILESVSDSDGNRFFAKMHIIDTNAFEIVLTEAVAGNVDVIFGM